jgi:3-hydroxymyristoyl/3-hydroxydecanoyl-(acyl carrier protein) dehydratase
MFELIRSIRIDSERATGTAELAATHPGLLDHFPGRPILPGTWLVELAAQIAGPLAEEVTRARHGIERWAVLAMIQHAKLLAPVALPATLAFEATIARCEPSAVTAHATARRGEVSVLRADLVFALIEAPPGSEAAVRERHDRLERWKVGT